MCIRDRFKGGKYHERRYFRIDEFYEECIKHPQFLELLKKYVAKNKDVQHIYNAIATRVLKTSTDIHEVPSNQMSGTSISKATTSDMVVCDVMTESESAKDDDTSSTESSIDDRWKGYTMQRISDDYAAQHEEVLCFYDEIEKEVINATTDDDISSSSNSSSNSSSS
eukprot:13985867-Ditylum_brightwellii.AAC.1